MKDYTKTLSGYQMTQCWKYKKKKGRRWNDQKNKKKKPTQMHSPLSLELPPSLLTSGDHHDDLHRRRPQQNTNSLSSIIRIGQSRAPCFLYHSNGPTLSCWRSLSISPPPTKIVTNILRLVLISLFIFS